MGSAFGPSAPSRVPTPWIRRSSARRSTNATTGSPNEPLEKALVGTAVPPAYANSAKRHLSSRAASGSPRRNPEWLRPDSVRCVSDIDDERAPLLWPDVPRRCFSDGPNPLLNACVQWVQSGRHGMFGYVEGYRRAACAVYEVSVATNTSPDYTVFPIAFLWRHHIELALKDIIAIGRYLQGEGAEFPPHHFLLRLWQEARPHIARCGAEDSPELDNVEANIREFERVDPHADGFRYPLDKKQRTASLPNAPEYVNLESLHEGLSAVANFLDAVHTELSVRRDYVEQEAAELDRRA